jgi:hypothetical protein
MAAPARNGERFEFNGINDLRVVKITEGVTPLGICNELNSSRLANVAFVNN